jgi:hypothetical protein
MSIPPDAITLRTEVHLCWQTDEALEAAVWRTQAERAGARAIHLYRHEDGSGYTLTLKASVEIALTRLCYTPDGLAVAAFEGGPAHVRRLQDLYWSLWLPRHHPVDIGYN